MFSSFHVEKEYLEEKSEYYPNLFAYLLVQLYILGSISAAQSPVHDLPACTQFGCVLSLQSEGHGGI